MVPSSATAIVVFLLLVTPGVAFELLWQRTRPRRDESTFVEISRVLLAGMVLSGASVATLAMLGAVLRDSVVDLPALLSDGGGYVQAHPELTLRTLAAVPVVALLYGVAAHDLLTPQALRRINQGTGWHVAFGRMAGPGVRVFLSVQLKDGTTITGYAAGYSTDPDPGRRDLLLGAPLSIRRPGDVETVGLATPWQLMVVSGADINTIAAAYVDSGPGRVASGARPAGGRRPVIWVAHHAWQACLTAALCVVALLAAVALFER